MLELYSTTYKNRKAELNMQDLMNNKSNINLHILMQNFQRIHQFMQQEKMIFSKYFTQALGYLWK